MINIEKVTTLEGCIIEVGGKRICTFCGTELADGQVCTCNKYKLVVRNLGLIDNAQSQIEHYQQIADEQREHYQATIDDLMSRMPYPSYVQVGEDSITTIGTPTIVTPTDEGGEETGNDEPTEGGGE